MPHDSTPKASDDQGQLRDHDAQSDETREMLHQLRTPLTIISGYVQLLQRRSRSHPENDDAALDRSLQAIEAAVDRMTDIVKEHREEQIHRGGHDGPDRP